MTKDDRIASYKYSVLHHARKHKILLIPVRYSIYPEPSTISG